MEIDPLGLCGYVPTRGPLLNVGSGSSSFPESARLTAKGALGVGNQRTNYYGPDSSFAEGLKYAKGVNEARERFAQINYHPDKGTYNQTIYDIKAVNHPYASSSYSLNPFKYWAGAVDRSAVETFMGSYDVEIYAIQGGKQRVTVTNESHLNSYSGGLLPRYERNSGIAIPGITYRTVPLPTPGGTIYQNVSWEEPLYHLGPEKE